MSEWASIWRARERYLQQLSSAQGQKQNQRVAPLSQVTLPPHFILEELELEKVDFSPESFAGLLRHVDPLAEAEWDLRKSIWMFSLGLVPIQVHLTWQWLRRVIVRFL
jgi:hypothetical protein